MRIELESQSTRYIQYIILIKLLTFQNQKAHVQDLEGQYGKSKSQYSQSLKNLEIISEEIHTKRKVNNDTKKQQQQQQQRGECVGAESTTPPLTPSKTTGGAPRSSSRRRSTLRRQSEEKIKTALIRQRSQPVEGMWRYRHSLLMDLDIDFDIGNEDEMDHNLNSPVTSPSSEIGGVRGSNSPLSGTTQPPLSPGAKSVDIGCFNMKYYDDYQVLDIAPFLENQSFSNKNNQQLKRDSMAGDITSTDTQEPPGVFVGNRVRSPTTISEFDDIMIPDVKSSSLPETPTTNTGRDQQQQRKHSHAVVITMEDALKATAVATASTNIANGGVSGDRKISAMKPILNIHFPVIAEDPVTEESSEVANEIASVNVVDCVQDSKNNTDEGSIRNEHSDVKVVRQIVEEMVEKVSSVF